MPAKVRSTPVDGDEGPPSMEEEKEVVANKTPASKKPEKVEAVESDEAQRYILTNGPIDNPSSESFKLTSEETIYEDIKTFADSEDVNPNKVHAYELGREVHVEISISIKPM